MGTVEPASHCGSSGLLARGALGGLRYYPEVVSSEDAAGLGLEGCDVNTYAVRQRQPSPVDGVGSRVEDLTVHEQKKKAEREKEMDGQKGTEIRESQSHFLPSHWDLSLD